MEDTDRKTRQQLRGEFERLAQFGTWERFTSTGEVVWSPGIYRVLGLPDTEPAALETFRSLIHPDDRPRYRSASARLEQDGEPFAIDLRLIRRDGETRHLQTVGHRTGRTADGSHRLVGAIQDITELRRLETDQADLLARLLRTADEERRRLAGRVHDDVVQELAVAQLRIEARSTGLDETQAEQIRQPIITAAAALRRILADLAPPNGRPDQFRASIASYADQIANDETKVHLAVDDVSDASPDVLLAAQRIIREALSNASRHARATSVTVLVATSGTNLSVRIEDDGVGFETATSPTPGHIGLQLMHERAEDLECDLHVDATPGVGTTVSVALPLVPVTAT